MLKLPLFVRVLYPTPHKFPDEHARKYSETQYAMVQGRLTNALTGPIAGILHRLARLPETDPWRRRPRCLTVGRCPETVLGLRLLDESRRAQFSSLSLHFGHSDRRAQFRTCTGYWNDSGKTSEGFKKHTPIHLCSLTNRPTNQPREKGTRFVLPKRKGAKACVLIHMMEYVIEGPELTIERILFQGRRYYRASKYLRALAERSRK